jgi:(5-formylfuran-3-yl)methyl phosphate synthase
MTGMLASVNSLEEAKLVMAENVDIIDLKDPALGSLGKLDFDLAKEIIKVINGKRPVSATIGDLPMQPELIFNAVKSMAETGVNYIKIGLSPDGNQEHVIKKLAPLTSNINLIAVLFADTNPDFYIINKLIAAGFKGIMLDTQDKTKGSLTEIMAGNEIEHFVNLVKATDTICGLAGSLRLEDIPLLLPYQPDYLGFRGALCDHNDRVGRTNIQSVQTIKRAIVVSC